MALSRPVGDTQDEATSGKCVSGEIMELHDIVSLGRVGPEPLQRLADTEDCVSVRFGGEK